MEKNYSNFKKAKTMKEVAEENYPDPTRKKLFTQPNLIVPGMDGKLHEVDFDKKQQELSQEAWKKQEEAAIKYNENIYTLDEEYASVEPVNSVIVRCFHLIPEIDPNTGLIIPMELPVAERTQNGVGVRQTLNSPWKLSTKAVVIAIPEIISNKYNVGDTVQIINDARTALKISGDHPFELPHGYTLPSYHGIYPPSDAKNRHFGYLRIDPFNYISAVLKRAKKEE